MKNIKLSKEDLNIILESLGFTKQSRENYQYHSPDIKKLQIKKVDEIISKIRALKKITP